MSNTRAQFIDQCLANLGILVPGQSITADLVEKMDLVVDNALATLAGLDIYYVQDAGTASPPTGGDIEDSAFLPLADYVADKACASFNLPADQKMKALALAAERTLVTLSAPARTLRTLRVDQAVRSRGGSIYRGTYN